MKTEEKVSQMILDVAAQFIELETSEEARQTNLNIACMAWNLSILPKSKRNKEYNKYLDEMRMLINDKEIMNWLKEDFNGLMQAKIELYPDEKKQLFQQR